MILLTRWGVPPPGGGVSAPGGVWSQGGACWRPTHPTPGTATAAGGTHPTGMHSCFTYKIQTVRTCNS